MLLLCSCYPPFLCMLVVFQAAVRELEEQGFDRDEHKSLQKIADKEKREHDEAVKLHGSHSILGGVIRLLTTHPHFTMDTYTQHFLSLYGIWIKSCDRRITSLPLLADLTGGLVSFVVD